MTQLVVTIEDLSLLPELTRSIMMLRGVKDVIVCKMEDTSDGRALFSSNGCNEDRTPDCDRFEVVSEKEYRDHQDKEWLVGEKQASYQPGLFNEVGKKVSQEELDAESMTLEESKRNILDKIHRHFHQS